LKDARGAQWTKLIFNASTNPVGALTLLHHRAATHLPPTGALFNDLIAEGEAVAKALGIELHGDPRALVEKGASAPGKHNASMLQDVLAKRQTEVDFMNGAIVEWGKKIGVPTPLNRAMWQLIKGSSIPGLIREPCLRRCQWPFREVPMQNKPAPSTEIRRAERKDIGTLVRMRIALLQEVGNLRSQADSKQLLARSEATLRRNCGRTLRGIYRARRWSTSSVRRPPLLYASSVPRQLLWE